MSAPEAQESGWKFIGIGVMWLLIFLGIGGCAYLLDKKSKDPLIVIKIEKSP